MRRLTTFRLSRAGTGSMRTKKGFRGNFIREFLRVWIITTMPWLQTKLILLGTMLDIWIGNVSSLKREENSGSIVTRSMRLSDQLKCRRLWRWKIWQRGRKSLKGLKRGEKGGRSKSRWLIKNRKRCKAFLRSFIKKILSTSKKKRSLWKEF